MAQEATAPSAPPPASGFFALMRNRNYALLWTSQGVSQFGDRFHWIAISLWVYAVTRSALSVSYAIIALMVGPAVVGLFAGALVDRWSRKATMVLADLMRGVLVALIPWLMTKSLYLVYLDLFLVSCASAFFRPAMLASIPQIVPKAHLMPANSFLATVDTGTEVIGPLAAGIFVQAFSYGSAMYVDAGSYFVSALLVAFLTLNLRPAREGGQKAAKSIFSDIGEAFRYIRNDRLQLGLLMLIFLGWWVSGFNSVQTPLAKGVFRLSDVEFGWLNSIWGVGFVVASLLLGWYGSRLANGPLIVIGFLGWAFATAAAGLAINAGMLYAAVFWIGSANIVLFISLSTTLMEVTPSDMLGRVFAIRLVSLTAVRLAAMLGFGVVADLLGARQAVVSMAGLSVFGVLVGLMLFPEVSRVGVVQGAIGHVRPRDLDAPNSVLNRLRYVIVEATDDAYHSFPQRGLNVIIAAIVGGVWVILLMEDPWPAIYIAGTVCGAVLVKVGLSRRSAQGSTNMRHEAVTLRRESEERGRNPIPTGPTAR